MKKLFIMLVLFTFLTACTKDNNTPNSSTTGSTTNNTNTQTTQSTPVPAELKVADYFPLTKDVHKVYKGTGNEYAGLETYVDYVKDDKIQIRHINGGTISVNVYQLKDGVLKKTFMQAETYYRYDYTSASNQDEIVIKEPIKVGTSWTIKDGAVRSITGIDKEIKTPAGDYKAIEITTKYQNSTVKDYYAKNTGLVKSEFSSNEVDVKVISELEKVESGVPYKQKVKFYYPEFLKDRVVYIEKDIESRTNDDIKAMFQKELGSIPENSGLTQVLPANAKVLGCKVDENTGVVTVDLSSQFITGTNAGSALEGMLLKCIANTFGDYFQKDKVGITIEGKQYESGHFIVKPGEYLTVKKDDVQKYEK